MKQNPLRKWRKERDISQAELAESMNVSQALVSHYERVGLPNSLAALRRIEKATGLTVDELRPE